MKRAIIYSLYTLIFLSSCSLQASPNNPASAETSSPGVGLGMMERHHAQVPQEYAGMRNPVEAGSESLARGGQLYAANCASCHGDGGMGDGPVGTMLNPPASPVAHSSQMMADDYLFWRISAGGAPFNSAMPAWKSQLDEQAHWDLINYIRALGAGTVEPGQGAGGAAYDPALEATRQAEMLNLAVEQKVITQAEALTFKDVHQALDDYLADHPEVAGGNMDERQAAALLELINSGALTQSQADAFWEIHDRLGNAGLMH